MIDTLSILGASTPFTVELLDALARSRSGAPACLVLHGRSEAALADLARYASVRVDGVQVTATTDLHRALEGADVVVHQIRYGGLEGRAHDARIAAAAGIAADETLGPAGLASALRAFAGTLRTGRVVRAECPDAWVVNLTNPVGAAVAAFHHAGVEGAVGVCELPDRTAARARERAGWPPGDAPDWSYDGFNHRGFVYGAPWFGDLVSRLRSGERLGGVAAELIRELGAVPVKHFTMLAGGPGPDGYDRAAELQRLRIRAAAELAARPTERPAALNERSMPWYEEGVLPVLEGLSGTASRRVVVTAFGPDGVPRERPVILAPDGVRHLRQAAPPPPVAAWLSRLEAHERAVVAAASTPSLTRVRDALALDPLVDADDVGWLAERFDPLLEKVSA